MTNMNAEAVEFEINRLQEVNATLRAEIECDERLPVGAELYITPQPCPKCADLEESLAVERSMRPQWAKGYSSDSVAAQVTSSALHQIWDLLGVKDQTQAVSKLTKQQALLDECEDALEFCSGTSYITDAREVAETALAKLKARKEL